LTADLKQGSDVPETLDPLATSELIMTSYRRYLRSLLPIRDQGIAAALDEQIVTSPLLAKGPFLEATPPYETGASIRELIDEGVLDPAMEALGGPALPLGRPLYRHQDQAIKKAVAGRNLVVATGTGSGKTESFLLPILNALAGEHSRGTLGPGVRALLLYPMNALANDQMKRLRKLLARTPHFTFGRYTGDTKERPRDARDSFEALNPGEPLLSNELLSREEMRATPPHLLLTNYAMLEYLLLRPADLDLFEGDYGGNWKFIAVDEAHVYDGAKAAEMAMLLRRLHDRVAPDRRLQCLATSATIGDDSQAATRFAARLFAAPFEWADGNPARQDLVGPTRRPTPSGPLWGPLDGADYRKLAELAEPEKEIERLAAERGGMSGTADWLLTRERRMSDLRSALTAGPQPFSRLADLIFDAAGDAAQSLAALVAVGSKTRDESGTPVLSARYHLFTRATEGAYTCLTAAGPHVSLGRHQVCEQCSGAAFEIGACQRCGAVYLTGSVEVIDGKPVLVPQKREDAPVWMLLDESSQVTDEDEETLGEASASIELQLAALCTGCGALHLAPSASCCTGAVLRQVQVVRAKGGARNLKKCVHCGARGSTVRRFESGQDAAAAVVSTTLYQALPPEDEHAAKPGGGRKLLLFSDSRQRAAFFAPYLQNSYGTLQHRRLIWEGLQIAASEGETHVEDLIDGVTRAATRVGVFPSRMSPAMKKRETALWVMQELVAMDDRQSLEGRGLLRVTLAREPGWSLTPALERLGLGAEQTWDLLSELARTLRQQGVLTMPDNVAADDEAFAPRKGPIFVRQDGSEPRLKVLSWLPTAGRNRRLDYIERVLRAAGSAASARDVLAESWKILCAPGNGWLAERRPPGLGVVRQVSHEWLDLEAGSRAFQCATCLRLAPVAVHGVCPTPGCQGTMTEYVLPGEDQDTDHYRRIYRSMRPIPLVATEHTAQWTGEEAARIQQQFLRGDVNALSCSTTFELGVDVGELQSVVMRNMPPTTANYVQRAGRVGRRTSSAALVVTYAQRASHDLSQYQNPIDMIAGTVRAPYVPLGNERIDRRHAHSIALAAFFRHGKVILGREWTRAGQFFLPGDNGSPAPVTIVGPFLTPVPAAVRESLSRVIPPSVQKEIGITGGAWAERLAALLEEVRSQFAEEIDVLEERRQWAFSVRKDSLGSFFGRVADTIRDRNLIGYLASRNVLPKYGFPVDTVDLMTAHAESKLGEKLELSRDLTSAIYEYAPGGEIVAGGKRWTSAGVHRRPGHDLTGRQFAVCGHCEGIQVTDDQPAATCPTCGLPYANADIHGRYVIPEFGFLAARDPQEPGMTPPRRSWNGNTYVLDLAAEPEEHEWRAHGSVAVTAQAGARGRLLALSEGPTGRGFQICPACGWGQANAGKPPKSHKDPLRAKECGTRLQPRYLAHVYETDLLELTFAPSVLQESDPSTLESLLAAILEGAADRLQIARDDIGGTLYPGQGGRRALVVYDTVPAGAGNVLRIARSLDSVLAGALERVATCDCGEETSCYGCLRNYRNQWRHDLLRRDRALQVLHRIGQLEHAEQPESTSTSDRKAFPELTGGTILTDTFTGQTKAMVLDDGRILMHGEIYADAQQAADAVDHNVDALGFWAAETAVGLQPLQDIDPPI
jgi:ATP-dependent helicase YprA (DUF1998 family)